MKIKAQILSALLCGILSMPVAFGNNCDSEVYRLQNPDKCQTAHTHPDFSFTKTIGTTAGALALIGGAIAIFSGTTGNASPATDMHIPTMPKYDMVGADISAVQLASITSNSDYLENLKQYNDIRLAYSLARGFTGAGSEIVVFDSGENTFHGGNVAHFASGQIAPNATVSSYMVADRYGDFKSFYEIGNQINSATNTNAKIYNFSWSADISANAIHSQNHLINMTDANFINSLKNAATTQDAIFVWAAGNDGKAQSSALSAMPIHIDELKGHFVNVVAWDSETGALADFSNACGITQEYCITAPGTNLETPLSQSTLNGTSFATPIVSAAIAVIREAFPYMQSSEITNLLFTTARDLGKTGIDEIYGHGMLDLERATRPVGTPVVQISDTFGTRLSTARISAPIGQKIQSKNLKFAFVDDFGRAFETNLNDNIRIKNHSIGWAHLHQDKKTSAKFKNLEFGIKETNIISGDGFLQTDSNNLMTFVRHTGNQTIGNINFFQETSLGITTPNTSPESMINKFSNIYTAAITIGAKYQDFSLSIGTPDTIIYGNTNLYTLSHRNTDGDYIFTNNKIDLTSVPSIEIKATYKSISAGFVKNPYGQNEIYMLAKTKISF
ncbi:MAG: S8 family serine peptidase [Alphaproteobacteria bacterium]|nr:S8 family serine peptidase [Alphaproteobacteria bacterium]